MNNNNIIIMITTFAMFLPKCRSTQKLNQYHKHLPEIRYKDICYN